MAKSARLIEAEKIITDLTFSPDREALASIIRSAKEYREKHIDKKSQKIEVWVANNEMVLLLDDPEQGISPLQLNTTYFMRQTIVKDIVAQLEDMIQFPNGFKFSVGQLFPGLKSQDKTIPRAFVVYGLNQERPFVKGFDNYVWANKNGVASLFANDPHKLKAARRAIMFNGTMAR